MRRRLMLRLRLLELLVGELTRWPRWLARLVALRCCLVVAARRRRVVRQVRRLVWLVDLRRLRA